MAAAFITCTTPRAMRDEHASAWLERRAEDMRGTEPVEEVSVRELRPRRRDPVWLVQLVLGAPREDWEELVGDLVRDLRRLGMRPTICIDERPSERATEGLELQHAA